ncbi:MULTISPECIES: hypothetical protein [Kitasatospora]|uniref:Uncharacterized protein n=1 Tax=Kitasatospora setae (strain ATCC 33774 / DSM 43861 / JCM 3304 / KCC A-0304 / NBRC 14216 / KM-6054) TaxID=452652 RepID=E4MZ34_KITSK|nr:MULTISPECIES: hypothetical protein [Kitasatospora]BAJ25927.1 hypothetical protein KSE_00750t [Kitasatospora setae KM-6054]BAJ33351.1 hypothetical protein KSE_75990t [Kitasatospora setae KM-6054]
MPRNAETPLNFSGPRVQALLVQDVKDYHVSGPAVVVNTGTSDVHLARTPRKAIPPLSSTILTGVRIEEAASLLILRVKDDTDIAGIAREPGWDLLGDLLGDSTTPTEDATLPFPRDTPLWKSPQDHAGLIELDPAHLLAERAEPRRLQPFEIRANLWFAPAGTDCFIHNQHDFIEVHTQLHGLGRMQKFTEQDHSTLYEDLPMSPGYTTSQPFCSTGPDGTYLYPWHQYRADTDCVWLAVEYHPMPHRHP